MRNRYLLLLVLGAALVFGGLLLEGNGRLRFLASESKLDAFETRIASVEEEFMRRSPTLRGNFARFERCIKNPPCDSDDILRERERIVREAWPDMLTRLLVQEDWGEGSITQIHHREFNEDIGEAGGHEQARACYPLLEYYLLTQTHETGYRYRGLRCLPA